jgi:hypothetical protein
VDVGVGEEGGKCHGVTVGELRLCNRRRRAQKCGQRACAVRPRAVAASSPRPAPALPPLTRSSLPPPGCAALRLITCAGVCTMVEP